LAETHFNLANEYRDSGRPAQAATSYRNAADHFEKLVREHPGVLAYQRDLAASYGSLGMCYAKSGQPEKAKAAYQETLRIQEKLVRDQPNVIQYGHDLGVNYGFLAELARDTNEPATALDWYAKAIRQFEGVPQGTPQYPYARQFLNDMHRERGQVLAGLHRHAEAVTHWDFLIEVSKGNNQEARLERALSLAYLGQHARASAEAESLVSKATGKEDTLYNAACIYSVCVDAVRKDDQLSPMQRDRLAEHYAAHAVGLLTKAHAAGLFKDPAHVTHLKKDPDLAPLRARDDFRKLLVALEEKAKTEAR
jgi:tetratricopeptide (TPR) repeat protein